MTLVNILTITGESERKEEVEYRLWLSEIDCNAYAIKPSAVEGASRIELYKDSDLQRTVTVDLPIILTVELNKW